MRRGLLGQLVAHLVVAGLEHGQARMILMLLGHGGKASRLVQRAFDLAGRKQEFRGKLLSNPHPRPEHVVPASNISTPPRRSPVVRGGELQLRVTPACVMSRMGSFSLAHRKHRHAVLCPAAFRRPDPYSRRICPSPPRGSRGYPCSSRRRCRMHSRVTAPTAPGPHS